MCCCCRFRWLVGAQTKEYAHPYSMMHRRLTTVGIEVAPHYHQLLVYDEKNVRGDYKMCCCCSRFRCGWLVPRQKNTRTRTP